MMFAPFPEAPRPTPEACAAPFACARVQARIMGGRACAGRYAKAAEREPNDPQLGPCQGCPAGRVRLDVLGVPELRRWTKPRRAVTGDEIGDPDAEVRAIRGRIEARKAEAAAAERRARERARDARRREDRTAQKRQTEPADAGVEVGEMATTKATRCARPGCERVIVAEARRFRPRTPEEAAFCDHDIDSCRSTLRKEGVETTPEAVVAYLRDKPKRRPPGAAKRPQKPKRKVPRAAPAIEATSPAGPPVVFDLGTWEAVDETGASLPELDAPTASPPCVPVAEARTPTAAEDAAELARVIEQRARTADEVAALDRRRASLAETYERLGEMARAIHARLGAALAGGE